MYRRALLILALSAGLAGCGPLERAELKRGVETLDAIAVEGRVLAAGVIGDRTKATFTRVHARELAEDAAHEAERLADATPDEGLERARDDAVELALRIADGLEPLQVFPGGEQTARQARADLERAARSARELSASLDDVP